MKTFILFFIWAEGVLCADGDQTVRLQQVEASDLTLPGITGVQKDAHIQWFHRSEKKQEKILNSQVFRGETVTEISERFKDRVQLDRSSGALTITNISTNDSGFYTILVTTDHPLQKTFSVTVYAPVSVPVIRRKEVRSSVLPSESCSPVCSVKNGQDVNLTWYKENEIISNRSITNETHLSVSINLSPEIQPSSNIRYICVSANPISNQTTYLDISEFCYQKPDVSCFQFCAPLEVLIRLVISTLVVLATVAVLVHHIRYEIDIRRSRDQKHRQ